VAGFLQFWHFSIGQYHSGQKISFTGKCDLSRRSLSGSLCFFKQMATFLWQKRFLVGDRLFSGQFPIFWLGSGNDTVLAVELTSCFFVA